ncbi:hypothetical protein BKA67DRAFT_220408 [Truncatella angustata]|uniref:Biotrophy-associated secreted protein 2 n=1 Tax=Truncatella angustata TaxID=152316 RepID=A0A9P9A1V0_9PEZI|nr:uncharacterized protein BKA67DRAFT_220408 [Truncatella angustata]KAH6658713.1 hypothetical protein BKA67DRAFT_220408 [Truncatella angustata]
MAILFAVGVLAVPSPAVPDPAGVKNIGNGAGVQFIGGECLSSADCASACCAFNNNGGGICSGVGAQFQNGKTGCGFGDNGAAAPATGNVASGSVDTSAPGSQNVGTGNGQQFITGQCLSDADCASSCCAGPKGACSAAAVAFDSGKTGCGFVGTA